MVWTLFHYGLTGWSMYALMGMALGYFSYRYNLPLTIRSALYPIFGKAFLDWGCFHNEPGFFTAWSNLKRIRRGKKAVKA